ncbi:sensory box sensor histidine kinase [Photobacterium aphoticum]|uniref:histidine kinase n=1 Tax=Photobacterium aphoticum TaxID=754436 RepID=A0A090QKQ6_9GAMM|nr:sensory box sensor histidine kinase [Photobacterium aphoticum]
MLYKDINQLLSDISAGVISHAYVPQSVLDVQLYFNKGKHFDVVVSDNSSLADVELGIVLREDSDLLRGVFNAAIDITTDNEIDLARLNHHRIIAQYGFDKGTATHVAAWVAGLTVLIILAGLIHTKRLKVSLLSARATEKRSYQQVEWLMKLLDNIPGMVVITDGAGKPILSNKAFKTCLYACELNRCAHHEQPCFFLSALGGVMTDDEQTELHLSKAGCAIEDRYFRILRESVINPRDGEEYNITVYDDFTELKQQQQQLNESKLQAIHALKAREAFLAMISHELRTPLAAMMGLMELLSSKLKQKENQELMQNAQLSAERLKLLVNDILDFSKIEAEQLQLDMYRSNAFNELCPVIRTFESHAQFKKLQFVMDWQPTALCMAELDWHRVVQIINNLLNNAIKFTDHGHIAVSVITAEQYLQLEVKDSGCGMTQEQLAHLFQPFAQGDRTITRRYGGSGLGMSIVQRLVVLMGGTIDVVSEEGQGTTVTVTLPAAFIPVDKHECKPVFAADQRIAQWLAAWQVSIDDNVASDSASVALMVESDNVYPDVLLKQLSAYMPNAMAAGQMVQFSGTVLVADDDPINRLLFQKQLSKLGLTTVIVNDGLEAIQTLQAQVHQIDVVITDCHMPNLDGYDLTLKIKGDATLSHLPVIGCTAEDSRLVTEKIKQVGMDDIVYKPYT